MPEDIKGSSLKASEIPDSKFDPVQLAKGIEVEKEHTNDPVVAKAIAKAHLAEIPDYYTRLNKMEEEAKKETKSVDAKQAAVSFFEANPNPKDSRVHALAEKLGIEPDKFEEKIYEVLSDLVKRKQNVEKSEDDVNEDEGNTENRDPGKKLDPDKVEANLEAKEDELVETKTFSEMAVMKKEEHHLSPEETLKEKSLEGPMSDTATMAVENTDNFYKSDEPEQILTGKSQFSRFLEEQGFNFPRRDPGMKPDEYLDVIGRKAYINSEKPYALVIYFPNKGEFHFATAEEAKESVPKESETHWQIIHLPDWKIIAEPKEADLGLMYFKTTQDGNSPHNHIVEINGQGIGKTLSTSSGPEHIHFVKNWICQNTGEDHHPHAVMQKERLMYADDYNALSKSSSIAAYHTQAVGVDLDTHMRAQQDKKARPLFKFIRKELNKLEVYEIKDFLIRTKHGTYRANFYKKEPNLFSGAVRNPDGQLIQEFDNQTLEVIASSLNVKVGKLIKSEDGFYQVNLPPYLLEEKDKLEPLIKPEQDIPFLSEETETEKAQAEEMGDLTNTLEKEISKNQGHTKIRIKNGEIEITLLKSKESKMGFVKDMQEKLQKAEMGMDEKKPDFNKKIEKPEEEDKEIDPVAEGDVLSEKKGMPKDEEPDVDDDMEEDDELGDEDEDDFGDDEDMDDEDMDEEGMDDDLDNEGLEYIKASEYEGGKQFWYKDPVTGQIIEKDRAPEGHPDNGPVDGSAAIAALATKLEEMSQKIDELHAKEIGGDSEIEPAGIGGEKPEGLEKEGEMPGAPGAEEAQPGEEPEDTSLAMPETEGPEAQAVPAAPAVAPAPAAAPAPAVPVAPPAEPVEEENKKVVKALQEKYPTVSQEILLKAVQKACSAKMKRCVADVEAAGSADNPHAVCSAQLEGKSLSKKIKKALQDKFPGLSEDRIQKTLEKIASGERTLKKSVSPEDPKMLKKSRLNRMWKVFGIEMPEGLDTPESLEKANKGIKRLQKCILNQGKTEEEANRVVNRAVIEKYELLSKGSKYFQNYKEWSGGYNFNTVEGPQSANEMSELRKSDADKRFAIKEYFEHREDLVTEKKTGINEKIASTMKPAQEEWKEYKTFKEPIKKSEPSEFEKTQQQFQDLRWNIPEWKEPGVDAAELSTEVTTDLNKRIQNAKAEEAQFAEYKQYNEKLQKSQKAPKTKSEEMIEKLDQANWGSVDKKKK